jgi:HSP20 family molecular chaperone IbpA
MMKEALPRAASIPSRLASDDEPDWIEAIHYYAYGLRQQGRGWRPPTDVYETDGEFVVLIEVAGMRRHELDVTLTDQVLRVRGRRQHRAGLAAYHQMEINDGEFTVEVRLPVAVDRDGIDASYSNGFLRVRLPKTGPRQIPLGS